MLTIEQVADHVLDMSPYKGLSNRELQKILYFAQGFHLAKFGEPLFAETLYAWDFGPVSNTIWHKYKGYGYNTIAAPAKEKLAAIPKDLAVFLCALVLTFGAINQTDLIEFSHADTPWASSYIPQANKILEKDVIRTYFSAFESIEEYIEFSKLKLAFHKLIIQREEYLFGLPNLGNDWISGKSCSPSPEVCKGASKFISGLERYIFSSSPRPEIPKLILGPMPSGGVGLEFKNSKVALYLHLHNEGLVEIDVDTNGNFDSKEISFPEFEEDFTPYYKVLV
ncbi:Panacea domain-containing protein [Janthinobacterium lividum]|uniref:Panacea domain-containing protein n=1 Tax=Janthinobacterium lividum TaxID=29581 RepID=UPI0004508FFC|nr:type II toxin-antitoxin system antitoxin SocA domain-containing protein [Janthinobacterium lividum]EZP41427.1 putative phage-associated protein [Janthinobacterium lividum]